jgi:purine-binding chemotaxis protein CheW
MPRLCARLSEEKEIVQILTLMIGGQEYALEIENVIQVIQMVVGAQTTRAPEFLEGLFNSSGHAIPIIDMRARFGLPSKSTDQSELLIVAQFDERAFALSVDQIGQVVTLSSDCVEWCEEMCAGTKHLGTIGRYGDRRIGILNPAVLLIEEDHRCTESTPLSVPLPSVRSMLIPG